MIYTLYTLNILNVWLDNVPFFEIVSDFRTNDLKIGHPDPNFWVPFFPKMLALCQSSPKLSITNLHHACVLLMSQVSCYLL